MAEVTLTIKTDGIFNAKGHLAKPDFLSRRAALRFARKMARFHAGPKAAGPARSADGFVDLYDLLHIPDPGNIDIAAAWAPTSSGPPWGKGTSNYEWGFDWARFPIGVDMASGEPVYLDFKEPQEFIGMGHVAVVVGTSGSGKTILLSSLVAAAALTHSPDDLIIMVFDFKGSSLVVNVRGFPHIVGAMANLADDRLWIKRMRDVVVGEIERRFQLIHAAGVTELSEYLYLRDHCGEKLEKIPWMVLVIDEFTELFKLADDAKDFLDYIARQGRSCGVRLILGSQRLGHEMHDIMTNVPIKIVLRTLPESNDSYELLGSDEAEHLPVSPPGAGILKTAKGVWRFQTAFPLKPYHPPVIAAEAVRADPRYTKPVYFTATGMAPAPTGKIDAPPPVEVRDPETGRVVSQIQATQKFLQSCDLPAPKPRWLPPLAPLSVEELVRRRRGKPWNVDYGTSDELAELRLPVGLKDRPRIHRQFVWTVDMAGNCAVIGRGDAGKTWAITTMITAAALAYTPQRVQFHVAAFSGPVLDLVARLPHVAGYARGNDSLRIERMIADLSELIEHREIEFGRLGITTMEAFRARKFGDAPGGVPDDPFGEVCFVVDGWPVFVEQYQHLIPAVERILQKGPNHGVHGIVSTSGWIGNAFTGAIRNLFSSNIELRLAQLDDYTNNNKDIAHDVPFGSFELHKEHEGAGESEEFETVKIRGRGTTMDGFHGQVGLPEMVDGSDVAAAVASVAEPDEAIRVQVLPTSVTLDEVVAQWEPRPGLVPFGVSENGLVPAYADFAAYPHLILTGRAECGLSSGLRTVAQSVMDTYPPGQASIYVIDPNIDQTLTVEGAHFGGYAFEEQAIRRMITDVAVMLEQRMPPADLGQRELAAAMRDWKGPEIFVLVDREEALAAWDQGSGMIDPNTGHPLEPLVPYIARARQVGFHLVMGRNIAGWQMYPKEVIAALLKAKTPAIIMDGNPEDGFVIGTVKAVRSEPGRGIYLTDRSRVSVQIALPRTVEES